MLIIYTQQTKYKIILVLEQLSANLIYSIFFMNIFFLSLFLFQICYELKSLPSNFSFCQVIFILNVKYRTSFSNVAPLKYTPDIFKGFVTNHRTSYKLYMHVYSNNMKLTKCLNLYFIYVTIYS